MNQRSSTPPTPPGDASSFPPKEMALSSPDVSHEVSAEASNSAKDDRKSPSPPGRKLSFYLEQMSQVPDVRQDKIAYFQKAIDSQNYVISAEKLADSLIQELHPHPEETRPPTT
ncbi:flagellar biosynthesis anti-sigma factor FlgM [Nitrospira sp. T9]|uniref:flagellar biosynthesis anti-sigma factor FlgM n=1 Tax=unclassified Nitrospira TaxID=2652172 RepID=UPI003F969125